MYAGYDPLSEVYFVYIEKRSIAGTELRTKQSLIVRLVESGPARIYSARPLAALQLLKGRSCGVDEHFSIRKPLLMIVSAYRKVTITGVVLVIYFAHLSSD